MLSYAAKSVLRQAEYPYDAFISYSHARDREVAAAVQHGMHRLAKRWHQVRALRVFRDDTSLSANPQLWNTIEQALRQSRFFVLMASPEAANSPWVQQEIAYWQRNRTPDTFLIVLTAGTIEWRGSGFDWSRTTALPRQLDGWFAEEPLWVVLGDGLRDTELSLRNVGFRTAVCRLAAPVHGRPMDELDNADIREHRLAARIRRAAVVALSVLLVLALVAGVVAWQQRNSARHQARVATSQVLAGRAQALAGTEPRLAAQLALYGYELEPTRDAIAALGTLVQTNRHVRQYLGSWATRVSDMHGPTSPAANEVAVSGGGGTLAYYSVHDALEDPGIHVVDLSAGKESARLPRQTLPSGDMTLTPDGARLVLADYNTIEVWDVASRSVVRSIEFGAEVTSIAVSSDGRFIAAARENPTDPAHVAVWDTASGAEIGAWRIGGSYPALTFSADGRRLIVASPNTGRRRTFDITARTWSEPAPFPQFQNGVAKVDQSGERAVVLADDVIEIWDLAANRRLNSRAAPDVVGNGLAMSASGNAVTAGSLAGRLAVYDGNLEPIGEPIELNQQHSVVSAALSADGGVAAFITEDGGLTVVTPKDTNNYIRLVTDRLSVASSDGRIALVTNESGTEVWDLVVGRKRTVLPFSLNVPDGWHSGNSVAADSGGARLAVVADGQPSLWDGATGARIDTTAGRPPLSPVPLKQVLGFLPDDRHVLAVTEELQMVVIDAETGEITQRFGDEIELSSLAANNAIYWAVSVDRSAVVLYGTRAGTSDRVVGIWRADGSGNFRNVRTLEIADDVSEPRQVAISGDGSMAAVVDGDGRITLLRSDGQSASRSFGGRLQSNTTNVAFSADGRFLVQDAQWEGAPSLLFWDTTSGELATAWALSTTTSAGTSTTGLTQLVPGPNGTVVTVGPGGIDRWIAGVDSWRDVLCAVAGDEMTDGERDRYLAGSSIGSPCGRN
ncbi:TIR domain-containing protein [Nocardia sp. BMG51109]|uniref:TIR domain-containing protein n=1 Tax=Nocardia sp. BMG51109 TaxID=1056816 RepID=UPI0018DC20A5|nr:TIR domain-containing protein [Nocardia sp. BMG51109]